jgi:hypothetical protein
MAQKARVLISSQWPCDRLVNKTRGCVASRFLHYGKCDQPRRLDRIHPQSDVSGEAPSRYVKSNPYPSNCDRFRRDGALTDCLVDNKVYMARTVSLCHIGLAVKFVGKGFICTTDSTLNTNNVTTISPVFQILPKRTNDKER